MTKDLWHWIEMRFVEKMTERYDVPITTMYTAYCVEGNVPHNYIGGEW